MIDLLDTAFSQYGVREESGPVDNSPQILAYFSLIGHDWVKTDETAWCAAYVNWCLKKSGYKDSGQLTARSLLGMGNPIFDPKLGDLVVLWRIAYDSVWGHVGFFIRESPEHIYMLGGNQDNQVCIKPYQRGRLLNYIRPEKLENT